MPTVRQAGRFLCLCILFITPEFAAQGRELTFDERIAATRAVEDVYWQHRIWPSENPGPKPALAEVLTDGALRAKVETVLRESVALEMWGRPITANDLQSEMERIARDSHRPDVLGEVFAALHDDPLLIAECLARPILADQRIGELAERDSAFAAWWSENGAAIPAEIATTDVFTPVALQTTTSCTNDTWMPTNLTGAPIARRGAVTVWTGSEVIVWGGIWAFNGLPLNNGGLYDPATDSWRPFTTAPGDYPGGGGLSGVWTGTRMIVWGGGYYGDFNSEDWNKGGRYDPTSNNWQPTSIGDGVPSPRLNHTAVWSGTRMIVWGGYAIESNPALDSGGVYDPTSNSWTPTNNGLTCTSGSRAGQPCHALTDCPGSCSGGSSPGQACTSAQDCLGGCHNNPSVPCSTNLECQSQGLGSCNAPLPGTCSDAGLCQDLGAYHPSARVFHTAVWTGDRMVLWGGSGTSTGQSITNSGARYDPSTDTWTATSTGANVPSARTGHDAVWTGTEMVVWGGGTSGGRTNTGARYNPVTDTWTPTGTGANVPSPRSAASAVWTGDEMIVWGGSAGGALNTGGRYRPATDAWSPTSIGANVPSPRVSHTAAWTGSEMVVWGGGDTTGGRYCATPACAVQTWYHDADGDGYGVTSNSVLACAQPPGYQAASGDCNDANAGIHPGVAEVCGDGVDNDCDGIADDAGALAGSSVLSVSASGGGTIAWTPLVGANGYDVVRGSLNVLATSHGDFTLATGACLANDVTTTSHADAATPAAGQGLWYLVRGENCAGAGTFDSGAGSQVGSRDAEIQASGSGCP